MEQLLPLPNPISIFLETTNRCPFRCAFCPQSFDDYAEKAGGLMELPTETFNRLIAEMMMFPTKVKVLRFYGIGEPLLDKRIPSMIGYAYGIAERTELTTNASALTEKTAKALIESGLDYLRISIYGTTADGHKAVTQSNVKPELIASNVERFHRLRGASLKPYMYAKMIAPSQEEAEAFSRMYKGIVDEVAIESMMDWNSSEGRRLSTLPPQGNVGSKAVCPFPWYTLFISANGDATCCCVDYSHGTRVGNVHNQTIMQIWHGPKMEAFRRMHLERRRCENVACKDCTYLDTSPDNLDHLAMEHDDG